MFKQKIAASILILTLGGCGADSRHKSDSKHTVLHAIAPASSATTRNPSYWPFAANSPWNTSLGSGAVYSTISSGRFSLSGGASLNVTEWSHPVYVSSPSDNVRNFYDIDNNQFIATMRSPDFVVPDSQSDGNLHIIDGSKAVEMWRASRKANGDWQASAAVLTDLTGQGFYDTYRGVRAGGMSAIGGLIRREELLNLNIPHALAVAMYTTSLNRNAPGGKAWVWPASWADGYANPGASYGTTGNLYMGSLMAIPPEVDITKLGLGTQGLAVAKAMQDYGAYITDTGSANMIYYAEPAANGVIQSTLARDLGKLTPYLKVVTNNTPSSVGGGGTRRRGEAPPFTGAVPVVSPTPVSSPTPIATQTPIPTPTPIASPTPVSQPIDVRSILGVVRNASGQVLPGAKVHLYASNWRLLKVSYTNASGSYSFQYLPAGTYYVGVYLYGYNWVQRTVVVSNSGQAIDFTMFK